MKVDMMLLEGEKKPVISRCKNGRYVYESNVPFKGI